MVCWLVLARYNLGVVLKHPNDEVGAEIFITKNEMTAVKGEVKREYIPHDRTTERFALPLV